MLLVQKYGGTSVMDCQRIKMVAEKVANRSRDCSLVVVVSAMAGFTDKVIEYSNYFTDFPDGRELDLALSSGERLSSALLSIALNSMGVKSISLSGRKAGILTDSNHTVARVSRVDTSNIVSLLNDGYVVVVAGFQGVDCKGEVTTLGRGGSDLTAVVLAAALKAHACEIYSDVDGVYTTDPRVEPKAKKIEKISYEEMLELSSMGAKVLLGRSVEVAKKMGVKLYAKGSFCDGEGTLITTEDSFMEKPLVSGIALDERQSRVGLVGVKDEPGIAAEIFKSLAEKNANVDMIVQTIGRDSKTNIDFTVQKSDIEKVRLVLDRFDKLAEYVDFDDEVAIVSIVGLGMKNHTGVASKAFSALAERNINIMMISTSEIKVSMLVSLKDARLSVQILHGVYDLDK